MAPCQILRVAIRRAGRQIFDAADVICSAHAYEGTEMTYDWTGDVTRKRNRLRLASAVLLSVLIVLGIPAAILPFL